MTLDDVLNEIRSVVPADWSVWADDGAGLLRSYRTIGVKGLGPDGKVYGVAVQYSGYRAVEWGYRWKAIPDDYTDMDTWPEENIPQPPQRDGLPGEHVRVGVQVPFDYVWGRYVTRTEPYDLLEEVPVGWFADWARRSFATVLP